MNKKEFKLIDRDATVVKIKCRYCEAKDSCKRREHKERYEEKNIISYCSLTPNRPRSNKRSKRKNNAKQALLNKSRSKR